MIHNSTIGNDNVVCVVRRKTISDQLSARHQKWHGIKNESTVNESIND
jgi:hypothetical protein